LRAAKPRRLIDIALPLTPTNMRSIDEEIARRIQEAADTGELARAKSYGRPM